MPRKKPQAPKSARGADIFLSERARLDFARADLQRSSLLGNEPSDLSTCLPASISVGDVKSLSEALDRSLDISAALGPGRGDTGENEWDVQSQEEILRTARRCVQEKKPWREEVDDASLERRRQTDRIDRGYLIILPDNRVRPMDAQLSRRVRAQLLGEEEVPEVPALAAAPRRQEEKKPRGPRRMRNPWYLSPGEWFAKNAATDPGKGEVGRFPYDQMLRGEAPAKSGASVVADEQEPSGDGPHRLTQREKETLQIVEAYKQHMKGSRLPHFLQ